MDEFEYSESQWSGPICIKRDVERNVIQLEAWSIINGEPRCVRSFSLYMDRLDPETLNLIEEAIRQAQDR